MALIKCKECGAEVSSKAKNCQNCGIQVTSKPFGCLAYIVIIFLGLIFIVVIVGVFYDSPSNLNRNSMDLMLDAARTQANKPENNNKTKWLKEEREIAFQEGDLEAAKVLGVTPPVILPKKEVVNNIEPPYSVHTKGMEAIYRVSIDNRIALILTTDINAEDIHGSVQYDEGNNLYNLNINDSIRLDGKKDESENFELVQTYYKLGIKTYGSIFVGHILPDGLYGEGTWISSDKLSKLPFKMKKLADIWVIDDKSGAEAAYPVFKDIQYSKFNDYLLVEAMKRFQEHFTTVRQIRSELKDEPSVADRISNTSSCGLEGFTAGWVSLLCSYESYSGGVHGGLSLKAANYFLDDNGNVKLFRLWDVLVKSQFNIKKLSQMIIAELKNQGASGVLKGEFTVNNLIDEIKKDQINVTLLLGGLAFYFDPYYVGGGSEGSFRAVISNADIKSMIRVDGPLHERNF